jgi:uncharacterized cofD-like protein
MVKPSHVVALGGGTGLPMVLRGLRQYLSPDCRITAVVTAADSGGSSGALRTQYGVLPPGDIRNCLIALARVAPEVSAALQFRFDGLSGTEAAGPEHAVGNLLLAALDMVAADGVTAIRLAAELLGIRDTILPSTTDQVHLVATMVDGREIRGEAEIPRGGGPIARLHIDPADASAAPGVLGALKTADAVILGPGSLYTSILATLIIPGMVEGIKGAPGPRILVGNLMTEPGETDHYGLVAHLDAFAAHGLAPEVFDYVVVNSSPIPSKTLARYEAEGAEPVKLDLGPASAPPLVVAADLLDSGPVLRHAPDKLGPILRDLVAGHRERAASGARG